MESKLLIKFDKSPDLKIWAITCMSIHHNSSNKHPGGQYAIVGLVNSTMTIWTMSENILVEFWPMPCICSLEWLWSGDGAR